MSNQASFPHGLLWLGSGIFTLAYISGLFVLLPETIVTHLDWTGVPDSWGDRTESLGVILCIFALVQGMFYGFTIWIERIPLSILNIPWKNYWCANPERMNEMYRRTRVLLQITGYYCNFIFLGVLASIHTTTENLGGNGFSRILSFALFVSTVVFIGWIFRFFRPPNPS